jgi:hypothetical protein
LESNRFAVKTNSFQATLTQERHTLNQLIRKTVAIGGWVCQGQILEVHLLIALLSPSSGGILEQGLRGVGLASDWGQATMRESGKLNKPRPNSFHLSGFRQILAG